MKRNVGTNDRIVRILVGVLLVTLTHPVAFVVALILLLTGVTGHCPLYRAIGMNTLPRDETPGVR